MSELLPVSYEGKPCYEILLEHTIERLPEKLSALGYSDKTKICIVTDSNLKKIHLETFQTFLRGYFKEAISFCFPAGEEHKNLDTVQKLYQELIVRHFERKDLLIAFGGGVVGDLTGFTAATYLRGIDFIQIPTTLLSQVDSSIGGKTGVDFLQYKNMVGAFYQPKLVYINLSYLNTLPKEQFISGMGEVVKHGLIQSSDYFQWLKESQKQILALQPDCLEKMVYESCKIKRRIVENDPKERGERALLNFGHTIGHAVEKLSDFKLFHGQCVGIGMAAACRISHLYGQLSEEECADILETLRRFGLPTAISKLSAEEILSVSKSDKKMDAGKIKFILLHTVGDAYIDTSLSDSEILSGIRFVLEGA